MRGDYDEHDLRRAVADSLGERSGRDFLARRLGDPAGPATALAVELARSVIGDEALEEVTLGSAACVCGLLVSAFLPPREPRVVERLGDAIATVRSFGRHAVIASQCDLAAFAEVETAVARILSPAAAPPQSTLLLFELGFALGLAAR